MGFSGVGWDKNRIFPQDVLAGLTWGDALQSKPEHHKEHFISLDFTDGNPCTAGSHGTGTPRRFPEIRTHSIPVPAQEPQISPPAMGFGGLIPKYAKHLGLIALLGALQRDFLSVTRSLVVAGNSCSYSEPHRRSCFIIMIFFFFFHLGLKD